jgi:hypothetical protein
MAQTLTTATHVFNSVDVQTVFYNRGTVPVSPPLAGTPIAAAASRTLPGNLLECDKPGMAARIGAELNAVHGAQAFVNVSGYNWRQYRTLTVSGTYDFVPRSDCETEFLIRTAGNTTVNIDLTHADILPGMRVRFSRPTSVGNLVVNFTNGTVMSTAGASGTTITVTQYGHVTLMLLGSAVTGGPKVLILESLNATVS